MPDKQDFRSLIEEVREASDIVEVISGEIKLDRGNKALCPFHEEKTPSFHVNPTGQYFKCFGCGVGGDIFRFLELHRKISFSESLRFLANRAGIKMEDLSPNALLHIKETRHVEEVLTEAADFYHSSLTDEAREYLHKRGLKDETIDLFKIGYARGGLLDHLTQTKNFPIETCLRSGVIRKTNGGKARDYFINRIVFPNIRKARVVHFSSRSLGNDQPKYLHLPGAIHHFYNETALQSPEVILTEGILDCLPAVQAGFNCSALYGTSTFKEDHLPRLSRAETIYLCLDGDKAGRVASLKIAGLLGEKARLVELPEDTDLGDYLLTHSREDLQELLSSAPTLIKHEINLIPADTEKTELPRLLKPVLLRLACLERTVAQAYLQYGIKERFKLKKEDIDAYRATVKKLRDELDKGAADRAGEEPADSFLWEDFEPFNPAQDFQRGKAYFTIRIQKRDNEDGSVKRLPHVITSAPEIFPLEKSEFDSRGLRLLREGQAPSDMSRWSTSRKTKNSVHAFLQGEAGADPIAIFDKIRSLFSKYLDYPDSLYHEFISLWCIGTYFFMGFEAYPYVYLSGTKRTGKTRTIEIAAPICFNSIMSASMTDAAMYRSTENDRCTIFHDEAAKYSRKNKADLSERLEIFNSGYKRSGSVRRCVGDDNIPTDFSTYSPKLLASIEGLEQTSADRTITLHLLRAKGEVPKFSHRRLEHTFQEIRNGLYVLALQYHKELSEIYSGLEMVKGLKDREDELWSPIFTISEFIDGYRLTRDPSIDEADLLTSRMIRLAFTCRDRKQQDEIEENPEQRILAAILVFMDEYSSITDQDGNPTEYYSSDQVLAFINNRDTLGWVTKHYLGKVLSRLQIIKDKKKDKPYLRVDEDNRIDRLAKQVLCYRLPRERVNDVAERYAIPGMVSNLEAENANH